MRCCCQLDSACTLLSLVATIRILLAVQLPNVLQHIIPDIGMPNGNWVRTLLCRPPQIEQVSGLDESGSASHCQIHLGLVAVSCKLQLLPSHMTNWTRACFCLPLGCCCRPIMGWLPRAHSAGLLSILQWVLCGIVELTRLAMLHAQLGMGLLCHAAGAAKLLQGAQTDTDVHLSKQA